MNRMILRVCLFSAASLLALPALAASRTEYGQVIRVEPVIDVIRVSEPRQVCWDEPVTYRQASSSRSRTPDVLGAVIGGALGNQVGKGNGRTAATVAGAALGASIGRDNARRNHVRHDHYVTHYEQRCRTESRYREEERIRGYDVTYRYRGEILHTRTDYDPGDRIPLQVTVRPVSR